MLDATLGQSGQPVQSLPRAEAAAGPSAAADPQRAAAGRLIGRIIAHIDAQLSAQVDAILHHPQFQRLEASWRGLAYLVERAGRDREHILIRVFNARWLELARDAERALEFDQAVLFKKVYEEEFGTAGGKPFGVLIGDFEMRHHLAEDHAVDDLGLLARIAETAAAALCPFITGVHPSFFGVAEFAQLERHIDLERLLKGAEYGNWHRLRKLDDARYLGLCLPRILMRLPYQEGVAVTRRRNCGKCGRPCGTTAAAACPGCGAWVDPRDPRTFSTRRLGFCYREDVSGADRSKYLWGNAAYAFGAVLIRAFADCAWFADIRGFERDRERGGVVTGLPTHEFGLDAPGVAPIMSVDVLINDVVEKEIADQGFIPLCHLHDTPHAAFFSNKSVYAAGQYTTAEATLNERLSTMLQYTLCVGRFAHYLKVQVRDRIGSTSEANAIENSLRDWLFDYMNPDDKAVPEIKARYPLRDADVQVRDIPGKPGQFQCVLRLIPHYQLDDMLINVRLKTELKPRSA